MGFFPNLCGLLDASYKDISERHKSTDFLRDSNYLTREKNSAYPRTYIRGFTLANKPQYKGEEMPEKIFIEKIVMDSLGLLLALGGFTLILKAFAEAVCPDPNKNTRKRKLGKVERALLGMALIIAVLVGSSLYMPYHRQQLTEIAIKAHYANQITEDTYFVIKKEVCLTSFWRGCKTWEIPFEIKPSLDANPVAWGHVRVNNQTFAVITSRFCGKGFFFFPQPYTPSISAIG
jgi:hypothetical protein